MVLLLFVGGLLFLIFGAEALVRGASRLAAILGLSPLVIGLTVVAFGTSSPELAVSVKSASSGQSSIALGNVIGSNIFNVLFILGLSALIVPIVVSRQLVRLDVPVVIGLSLVVLIFSLDGSLSRTDGAILLVGLGIYVWFSIHQSRRESHEAKDTYAKGDGGESGFGSVVKNMSLVVIGLALLVLGSRWLVDAAVSIAHHLGVSELVIGLTIVAAGTSLPEVVTSVIAAIRAEQDIAVGNIIGSNIFNIVGVLGLSSVVAPAGIEVSSAVIGFDIPIMITVAFACLPIFFTGGVITRWEGAVLLGYYIAYTVYLVLAASSHDALPRFSAVMLYFVIPLSVVTLIVVVTQEIRARKSVPPK